jgi:protoheme ferro-lyase
MIYANAIVCIHVFILLPYYSVTAVMQSVTKLKREWTSGFPTED